MAPGNLEKAALVVVDFQNDFCPPDGALAVSGGRDIAGTINKLLKLPFAVKVATQDWHPQDHISFASMHPPPNNKPFESMATIANPHNPEETQTSRLWPDHCIQGTKGAELVAELDQSEIHHIVKKGQDKRVEMYSAFKDPFRSPCVAESGLNKLLKDAGIENVYVVGLATDYCVKCTAIDSADHGFKTTVLQEGVKPVDQSEAALKDLQRDFSAQGVAFESAAELLS